MQTKQNWMQRGWLVAVLGWCAMLPGGGGVARAQYTNLHEFIGGASDGAYPNDSLTLAGTNLYGMTYASFAHFYGTVFKMNIDGSGYTNLHKFFGGAGDGASPGGSLTLSGTNLYGMTFYGGVHSRGVVFQINTDGSGYTNLHEFADGTGDGAGPEGSLTLVGTNLYGMTYSGGSNEDGVIFQINTDGSGYTNLHEFAAGAGDGAMPDGSLTLSGTTLYGMTSGGGSNGNGVVFQMNIAGTGYTNLHQFAGGKSDGSAPLGALTLSGTTLYGMTGGGGSNYLGMIFKMNTDGTGYARLHNFAGGTGDGSTPDGSLMLSGTTLYGMTVYGGSTVSGGASGDDGVIFQINTDGSGYTNLHRFAGGAGNGSVPRGSLIQSSATLYGLTYGGGVSNNGVVFALSLSNQTAATVASRLFFQDSAGTVASWDIATNGTFQSSTIIGEAGHWMLCTAGDIDGDGTSDLIFQLADGKYGIWLLNPDHTIKSAYNFATTGLWQVRACADYEGIGRPQLFFQHTNGAVAYWHITNTGAYIDDVVLSTNTSPWQLKAAVDVDGDGKAELFWQKADGFVAVWFHNPDATIRAQLIGPETVWELRAATDIDGDGHGDLLWQTPEGMIAGWFMNSNGTARATSYWYSTLPDWKLKAAGHY
jgi:uncharacterized repeat protein (TIGR03803 family)